VQELMRALEMSSVTVVLLAVVGVLAVNVVVLGALLARSRRRPDAPVRGRQLNGAGSPIRRLELELEVMVDFIRGLPELLAELQKLSEVRRIPSVLLNAMVRFFGAQQAVVLIRRRSTATEPELADRLIVAALASAERGLRVGSEVPIGEGQLGVVAQVQRAMDRQDFLAESAISHDRRSGRSDLAFDVVAPLMIGSETLGVVAFSRPERNQPRAKEMLQIIAQLGAVTWRNLTAFRNVKYAAEFDELTGILNKASLKLRLSELVYEARQASSLVSVFMFDIDHFKNYNDVNGHLAGDRLLRQLSELVSETVRADDIFGRFGGEEFLLIVPARSGAQALMAAESIRNRIAAFEFPFGSEQPMGFLSVSGGVATFPDDAKDGVELLLAADTALYRAKQDGRNRVCRAETGLNPSIDLGLPPGR